MTLKFITGSNCPTCHAMLPMIRQATREMDITLIEIPVETMQPSEIDYYNINSLPTLILEDGDTVLDIKYGRLSASDFKTWVGGFRL